MPEDGPGECSGPLPEPRQPSAFVKEHHSNSSSRASWKGGEPGSHEG